MAYLIIVWLVCPVLGGVFGAARGQAGMGILVGALLGPVGVIVACILPEQRRQRRPSGRAAYRQRTDATHPETWLPPSPGERPRESNPADPLDFLNE